MHQANVESLIGTQLITVGLFNLKQSNVPYSVRVPLLEEKFQSYDELSKRMLERLERAVEEISKSSQNISAILIRHEEKIERINDDNSAVSKLITKVEEDLNKKIDDNKKELGTKIDNNGKDIDEIKKTRWIWFGVFIATVFFLQQLNIVERFMPPPSQPPSETSIVLASKV
jgi:hypothetical protein